MSFVLLIGSVSFVSPVLFSQTVRAVEPEPNCISGELIDDPDNSSAFQIVLSCTNIENFASFAITGIPGFDVSYQTYIKLHPESGVAHPYNASIVGGQLTLYFMDTDGTIDRKLVIDANTLLNSSGDANSEIIVDSILIVDHNKPSLAGDGYNIISGSNLIVSANDGVLANDSDAEGGLVYNATVVDSPSYGDLILNADGSFEYTPYVDYYGPDSFTYSAMDDAGNINVATVDINDPQAEFRNVSFYSNGLNGGYAKIGDTVQVDFETNEPVIIDDVTIAGSSVVVNVTDETHFSASYVMQESDIEGPVIYSINVHDYADLSSFYSNSDSAIDIIFDKTAPVIDIGETDMLFEIHEEYIESAVATDDGEPIAVIASDSVDTDIPGDYVINYDAVDMAGNQAETVTRNVTVVDYIALAFDEISAGLAEIGIANNLDDVTTDNVTNFTGLYFEKSIDGVKMGRITFTGPLDLSDENIVELLQAIGSRMEAGLTGVIGV